MCSKNVEVTLENLEKVEKILFEWFSDNFLKASADKCHLILSAYKPFSINIDNEFIKISFTNILESQDYRGRGRAFH